MSSASKVGEIFTAAGNAFSKLGELSMQLQLVNEASPAGSGKWSDQEIDMLHCAISQFSNELTTISETIKNKTITQIKTNLKRKAYEEAGLSPPKPGDEKGSPKKAVQQQQGVVAVKVSQSPTRAPASAKKQKTAEVTLSALNAFEGDVDIEGLSDQGTVKKLDFDSDVDSSML